MKWIKPALLALLLAAIGVALWLYLFPSPERVIRKRLAEVEKLASFGPTEGPLAKVSNAGQLAGFCTPDVEVVIDAAGRQRQAIAGKDELLRIALAVRNQVQSFKLELLDPRVTVAPGRQSATVNLTAKATVPGERDFMVQELDLQMVRSGRDWLIHRVATVRTLR